jgi:Ca2+/Na+ antiporter|tara:strand:- start:1447 stop:1668 length:222 start_codon:yes stop_codon:yes gene_type:complete
MFSFLAKENIALSLLLAFVCANVMSHTADISPVYDKVAFFLLFFLWLGILSKLGKSSWIKRLRNKPKNKKHES